MITSHLLAFPNVFEPFEGTELYGRTPGADRAAAPRPEERADLRQLHRWGLPAWGVRRVRRLAAATGVKGY